VQLPYAKLTVQWYEGEDLGLRAETKLDLEKYSKGENECDKCLVRQGVTSANRPTSVRPIVVISLRHASGANKRGKRPAEAWCALADQWWLLLVRV
jgi:hypothetical protein